MCGEEKPHSRSLSRALLYRNYAIFHLFAGKKNPGAHCHTHRKTDDVCVDSRRCTLKYDANMLSSMYFMSRYTSPPKAKMCITVLFKRIILDKEMAFEVVYCSYYSSLKIIFRDKNENKI